MWLSWYLSYSCSTYTTSNNFYFTYFCIWYLPQHEFSWNYYLHVLVTRVKMNIYTYQKMLACAPPKIWNTPSGMCISLWHTKLNVSPILFWNTNNLVMNNALSLYSKLGSFLLWLYGVYLVSLKTSKIREGGRYQFTSHV